MSTFDKTLSSLMPEIIALRRELHKIPERAWMEHKTQATVQAFLEQHGCKPVKAGGTGLLLDLPMPVLCRAQHAPDRSEPGPSGRPRRIAVRADLDALPVKEATGLDFASQHEGFMHACGHDMHMAAVAGLAAVLARTAEEASGSTAQARDCSSPDIAALHPSHSFVRFIFQPAEESSAVKAEFDDLLKPSPPRPSGAQAMIAEGALSDVDAVIGLHCWPDLPAGTIGVDPKTAMAGSSALYVKVRGKGGHGATPHKTIDPVPVAANLILALQTISSRRANPSHPFVLSVCSMHAGTTGNVIPDKAELIATLRSSTPGFLDGQVPAMLEDMIHGICKAYGAEAEMAFKLGAPPVVNDATMVRRFIESGTRALGEGSIITLDEAAMTSEDYAYYAQVVPSIYVKLGVAGPGGCAPLHSPLFNPDERALETAIRAMGAFVCDLLEL